jgi:restriction system protein
MESVRHPEREPLLLEAAVLLSAVFALLALWGTLRHRALDRTGRSFDRLVEQHLPVLVRKHRQLIRIDDYGIIDRSRWEKEVGYFFSRIVLEELPPREGERVRERLDTFRRRLEEIVEAGHGDAATEARFERVRDGVGFELFCAEELKRAGWRVALTGASRDQGADIVAERGPERLVVQCKFLNRPVGNHAVQEVVAARSHHLGNRALVASNQRFTASAAELAATNGVELCHWSELARL